MNQVLNFLKLLKEAFKEWVRDRAQGLAASMAYYELLSVAPIIGFILFATDKIWGTTHMHEEVIPLLKNSFTPQLTKVIVLLLSTEQGIESKELATISFFSGIVLLWAGKDYFEQVKIVVETTWNKRRYVFGIKKMVIRAVEAFKIGLVSVGIIFLFISIRAMLPHPYILEGAGTNAHPIIIKLGQWITALLLVCSLRVFYFTSIPPVKVHWKNTIPGALLGGFMFIVGREIMEAHFFHRPDANAAESLIMVLIWFYYSGLTFIYSAEFTKLYVAEKQGIDLSKLKPDVE